MIRGAAEAHVIRAAALVRFAEAGEIAAHEIRLVASDASTKPDVVAIAAVSNAHEHGTGHFPSFSDACQHVRQKLLIPQLLGAARVSAEP